MSRDYTRRHALRHLGQSTLLALSIVILAWSIVVLAAAMR